MMKKEICPICGTIQRLYEIRGEEGNFYFVRHDNTKGVTCQGSHQPVMKGSGK